MKKMLFAVLLILSVVLGTVYSQGTANSVNPSGMYFLDSTTGLWKAVGANPLTIEATLLPIQQTYAHTGLYSGRLLFISDLTNMELDFVSLHFSRTCSQEVQIVFDSMAGANYDFTLETTTLNNNQNYYYPASDHRLILKSGDKIRVYVSKAALQSTQNVYVIVQGVRL